MIALTGESASGKTTICNTIRDAIEKFNMPIEIISADKGYCKCKMTVDQKLLNAMDTVHGGAIYTLADFTFAVAANWQKIGCVSLHSDISFLGPAKGDTLIAKAICIKNGKTTACYRVDVTDDLGNLIATVTSTGCHIK
jgi:acyl-CoA thioesterase